MIAFLVFPPSTWELIAILLISAVWTWFALSAWRNALAIHTLPAIGELDPPERRPRVSVIVPGRDEGERIEETIRRLLAQERIELELIVIDDRSSDDTPAILARLAADEPRLRTIRVDTLPDGWLGKCHACWRGAALATGDWLLFTDADIHMRSDLIARAVATARRDSARHLTLFPDLNTQSLSTRAAILAWGQIFNIYAPARRINADRGNKAIGVGAFNLVEATAYRAIGGHEPLKLEAIDDVKLGLLLRRGGFRQRVYAGHRDLEAEWAQSVPKMIKLLEKNWFCGVDYSVVRGLLVVVAVIGLWLAALAGPLIDPVEGWLSVASLALTIVPAAVDAKRFGWPFAAALIAPLMFPVFGVAGINSIGVALTQGGIRWRDTFYPLALLRGGMVR